MAEEFDHTSMSLLGRAKTHDDDAWRQLVHLYGPLVQKWCRQSGLQDEDTADVFQETFQAISKNLANFKPSKSVASFRSWLKTIVRTKTVDLLRHRTVLVSATYPYDEEWLGSRRAFTKVRTAWRRSRSLVEWLADNVTGYTPE